MSVTFDFRFLPVCDIKTGKMIFAEAVMPALGAIKNLQSRTALLDQLLQHVATGLSVTRPDVQFAVTLDVPTLNEASFLGNFREFCDQRKLDVARLLIQLKEPEFVADEDGALAVSSCHAAGFPVAVDGFLSDDGNFSVLSHPHVGVIKVDQSVISDIHECETKQNFIKGLFSLSQSLEKQLVVSGVDTERHAALVAELGPRYCQGNYVGDALPAPELAAFQPAFVNHTRGCDAG